jgi:hypothetical protein
MKCTVDAPSLLVSVVSLVAIPGPLEERWE